MSFLAPVYLLAGLAIGVPILLHLIRKTPRGRQPFSSLMFLRPSPPRFSRRKRIENWVLLILRAAALILLAAAFARPFWQTQTLADWQRPAKETLILLDRSASMQRPGYWSRALTTVRETIQAAAPEDSLQLMLFDETSQSVITFSEWNALPADTRQKVLLDRIETIQPGWRGTSGGRHLSMAAALFSKQEPADAVHQRLMLVSDLQSGGGWEDLDATAWPEQVQLQIDDLSQPNESNFSVHPAIDSHISKGKLRFRITNAPHSRQDSMTWTWTVASEGHVADAVPLITQDETLVPGQSQIVILPEEASSGTLPGILEVHGDTVTFDNRCYYAPTPPDEITILYRGDQNESESLNGLRFFIDPAFPNDVSRNVHIVDWSFKEATPPLAGQSPDWVIVGGGLSDVQVDWLKHWLQDGGNALFIARDAEQAGQLYELLDLSRTPVTEGVVPGHLLLGKVDLTHAALQPFRGPRFSDFTKLRFWKYRSFEKKSLPNARILAALENETPLLVEIPAGNGSLTLLASGWNRDDSDLAVWSKFVPLLNGLLEQARPRTTLSRQQVVGQTIPLSALKFKTGTLFVQHGSTVSKYAATDDFLFEMPGFYQFAPTEESLRDGLTMAVNLVPEESRTEPYPVELLAAAGISVLKSGEPPVDARQSQIHYQQLQLQALEARQQWWRWLMLIVILLLGAESALALWKGNMHKTVPA